ncbi:thioredoxin family protein, partial [Candidatus Micrarchaeota archaeon]|nr:thioredoxin family protein [Candidatus Micrarchaeota archaeon]
MSLTPSNYTVLQKGSSAPDFLLKGIDEKNHSIEEFANNKALLIVFMCNHCPYVVPKVPKLVELQQKYGSKGLQVIGINSNESENYPEDSFENMKKFFRTEKINFPYLIDTAQEIAKAYGAACTPDPFLFDAKQKLVYHGRIDDAHGQSSKKASTNELETAIQELLEKGTVSVMEEP